MTDLPDYIVIRPAPGLPAGCVPPHLDGRWLDTTRIPVDEPLNLPPGTAAARAVPTGRFEVRDYDGAVAEVYEVQPLTST